uniref:Fumarylacetoacetate hydrolase domain containing 2A n=1 Tax=Anser brachyrhynchus TaxID=132585 RepID=A0A8B9C1E3_9AVES
MRSGGGLRGPEVGAGVPRWVMESQGGLQGPEVGAGVPRWVTVQRCCQGLELSAGVPGRVTGSRVWGPEGPWCHPRAQPRPRRALASGQHRLPRAGARLLAPIGDPEKVICVGLNYRDHCLEQDVKVPKEPLIFSKFPSAIAGPFDDIVHPAESSEVDWEVELAAVIGKTGRHIQESVALEHVVGFTVANDVSARDWQMRRNGRQWLLGKTFDTFCPLGPAIVTKDSVTDVHNLSIRCSVNGQLMQSSSTKQLVFRLPQLVAWVSRFVTLRPGDVLLTGTPPGVGVFRKPPVFLKVSAGWGGLETGPGGLGWRSRGCLPVGLHAAGFTPSSPCPFSPTHPAPQISPSQAPSSCWRWRPPPRGPLPTRPAPRSPFPTGRAPLQPRSPHFAPPAPAAGAVPPAPPALQPGDEVRCEIEELGAICNKVV